MYNIGDKVALKLEIYNLLIDSWSLGSLVVSTDNPYEFIFSADSLQEYSASYHVINTAPVLSGFYNQQIIRGDTVRLNLGDFVSDSTNYDSEMVWAVSGNNKVSIDINNTGVIAITIPNSNSHTEPETIQLKVTDPEGASDSTSFICSVYSFAGGEGTLEEPYKIETIEQLDSIKYCLHRDYILLNDLDFKGTKYDSTNSINGWNPIGRYINSSNHHPFTGSFNGKGNVIKNMYLNSHTYSGLFGSIDSASILNIGVENCYTINPDQINRSGALVGFSNNSTISNCWSSGYVNANYYVGGLVGCNWHTSISKCYSSVEVDGNMEGGGLVGWSSNSTISNSYATGEVSLRATNSTHIGGLVGHISNYSYIVNCYSTGQINSNSRIGLVGSVNNSSRINYSYFREQENSSTFGIHKTVEELKQQANFENWDFDSIWLIGENLTFPRLSNKVPILLSVIDTNTNKDSAITLSMTNLEASDADGDSLILVVLAGNNYSLNGYTITPDFGYAEDLIVPLAVTDGIDTSEFRNMTITISAEQLNTESLTANQIQLYPNPAVTSFTINNFNGMAEVRLSNMNGKTLLRKQRITKNESISISHLPAGIYFIEVTTTKECAIKKLIKK